MGAVVVVGLGSYDLCSFVRWVLVLWVLVLWFFGCWFFGSVGSLGLVHSVGFIRFDSV